MGSRFGKWARLGAVLGLAASGAAVSFAAPASAASYTVTDEASCAAFLAAVGATGDADGGICFLKGGGVLAAGDSVVFSGDITFRPQLTISRTELAFTNNGSITVQDGAEFYGAGRFVNQGTFTVKATASFSQAYAELENLGGTITIERDMYIGSSVVVTNTGSIACVGAGALIGFVNIVGNAPSGCDSSPPVITEFSRTSANSNGWYSGSVTIEWTCSDEESGVVASSVSVTLETEGADQSATGTCTNLEGLTSSDTATGFDIDLTSPTLMPSVSPDPVTRATVAIAAANATDALSGVASSSCGPVPTATLGSNSVTCTATDVAGNTATASASYTVVESFSCFDLVFTADELVTFGYTLRLGTNASETIRGTSGKDFILAGGGNDRVIAGDGDDIVCGGPGNDEILLGNGNDRADGEAGRDEIEGGADNDWIRGGDDNDELDGGSGEDRLEGGRGNDELAGDSDNDSLNGGDGHDDLDGDAGNDQLIGEQGDDDIEGGTGNDDLFGGVGRDELEGNDGDDRLFGDANDDVLSGGKGNDVLRGGDGNDRLAGDSGNDALVGGAQTDRCDGGTNTDTAAECEVVTRVP